MNKFRRQGKSDTPNLSSAFRRDRDDGQLFYMSDQESKKPNIIARSSASKSAVGAMMRVQPQQHTVQMSQMQSLNEQETQEIDYETLTLPSIGKEEMADSDEILDQDNYVIPDCTSIDDGQCEVDTSSLQLTTEDGNVVLLLQGEESEEGNLSEEVEMMMTSVQDQEHDGPEEILQTMTVTDGSIVSTVPLMNDPHNSSDNSSTASYILVQIDDQGNNILLPVPSSSLGTNFKTLPMMKGSSKSFSSMQLHQHSHHQEQKVKQKVAKPVPQRIVEAKPFRFISTPDMELDGFISDENFHTAYIKTTNYTQKEAFEFEEPPMKKMKESPSKEMRQSQSYGRRVESPDKTLNGRAEILALPTGYQCGYCKQVAKDRNKIVNHICMAHKDGRTLLDCKSCSKKFYASKEIVNNLKGDLLCPNCGKDKKTTVRYQIPSSTITSHTLNAIKQRAAVALPLNPVSKTYTTIQHIAGSTSDCVKTTPVLAQETKGKTTKFVCEFEGCGKKFNTKFTFIKHKLVHADSTQRPYTCDICDEEFKYKSSLMSHFNSHSDETEPLLKCNKCSALFKNTTHLTDHMKLHQASLNFEDHDPLAFTDEEKEVKPEVFCHVCDDVFETREALAKHLEEKHSNKSDRPPLSDEKILNIVKKMKMGDRVPDLKTNFRSPVKEVPIHTKTTTKVPELRISPSIDALTNTSEKLEEKTPKETEVVPVKKHGRKSPSKPSMYLDTSSSSAEILNPILSIVQVDKEKTEPQEKDKEEKVKRSRGRPPKKGIVKSEIKEKVIEPIVEPIQKMKEPQIVKRGRGRPKRSISNVEDEKSKLEIKEDEKSKVEIKEDEKSEPEVTEVKRKRGRPGRPKKSDTPSGPSTENKVEKTEDSKTPPVGSRSLRSKKSDSELLELPKRTRKSSVGNKGKLSSEPAEKSSPKSAIEKIIIKEELKAANEMKMKAKKAEVEKGTKEGDEIEEVKEESEKEGEEENESTYSSLRKYAMGVKEGDNSDVRKVSKRAASKSNESPKELENSFVQIFKKVKSPTKKSPSFSH